MSETMQNALLFLTETLFNLYLFVLVVRLLLVWVRADYFHPVTQFIVKLTDWIIKPLRRVLPNIKNIETSTLVFALVLGSIKFYLGFLIHATMPNLIGIPILAMGDLGYLILQTLMYAIILQALLSLIQQHTLITALLYRITAPILQPISRIMPPVGGIDLSPIPAIILIQLTNMLLIAPIMAFGQNLAFS